MKSPQTLFNSIFPVGENQITGLSVAGPQENTARNSSAVDHYSLANRPRIQMPKPPFDAPLVKLRSASFFCTVKRRFFVQRPKFQVDVRIAHQRLSDISLLFLKSRSISPSEHTRENQDPSPASSLSQSMCYDEYKLYSEDQRAIVRRVPIALSGYLDRHRLYEVLKDVFSQPDGLSEYIYVNGRNTAEGVLGFVQIRVKKNEDQLKLVIKSNLGAVFQETIESELNIALYEMNAHLTRSVHRDSEEGEETLEMSEEI